jgi:hypothetical protein
VLRSSKLAIDEYKATFYPAVTTSDSLFSGTLIGEFEEAVASRFASFCVPNDMDVLDLTIVVEETREALLIRLIGKSRDEDCPVRVSTLGILVVVGPP